MQKRFSLPATILVVFAFSSAILATAGERMRLQKSQVEKLFIGKPWRDHLENFCLSVMVHTCSEKMAEQADLGTIN